MGRRRPNVLRMAIVWLMGALVGSFVTYMVLRGDQWDPGTADVRPVRTGEARPAAEGALPEAALSQLAGTLTFRQDIIYGRRIELDLSSSKIPWELITVTVELIGDQGDGRTYELRSTGANILRASVPFEVPDRTTLEHRVTAATGVERK